jgi:hypothetical protein
MRLTQTATRTPPTLEAFKHWAADCAPAARAVLLAQAFAELERERVDAYVRPIFDRYQFQYAAEWGDRRGGLSGPIPSPKDLYLCDDAPGLAAYYADCDDAHRAHGFTGPAGHCPALRAESLLLAAQNALIDLAKPLFGFDARDLYGEDRRKCLDLLLGACLKAEREGR